jgi:hypothetical protein
MTTTPVTSGPMSTFFARLLKRDAKFDGVRRINAYALRILYALMFFGLGQTAWTEVLTHKGAWESNEAVAWSVWSAFATLAGLGILHPIKMLPIILLEIFYKSLWLIIVAYPLWRHHELAGSPAEGTANVFFPVFIPILIVPWRYVRPSRLKIQEVDS